MDEEEIRREFFEDWLVSATRDEEVEKLIQNDERAKQIKMLEQELQQEKETSHHLQNRLDEADAKLLEEKQKNKKLEKVVDMMAEEIWRCNAIDCDFKHFKDNICKDEQDTGNKQICKECIKKYYLKKAGDRS